MATFSYDSMVLLPNMSPIKNMATFSYDSMVLLPNMSPIKNMATFSYDSMVLLPNMSPINNSSKSFSQFYDDPLVTDDNHSKLQSGDEQVTQNVDKKRKIRNGTAFDSAQSLDKGKGRKQKKCNDWMDGRKQKKCNDWMDGRKQKKCNDWMDGRKQKKCNDWMDGRKQKKCNDWMDGRKQKKCNDWTENEKKYGEESPKGYIHVRARRGQATDSHSLAERVRREKINERMKLLQSLVPGCDKVTGKADKLDEIINYVQSLQNQVEFLSMKLSSIDPMFYNFGMDLEAFMMKSEDNAGLLWDLGYFH